VIHITLGQRSCLRRFLGPIQVASTISLEVSKFVQTFRALTFQNLVESLDARKEASINWGPIWTSLIPFFLE
jgi:hypothetical protein